MYPFNSSMEAVPAARHVLASAKGVGKLHRFGRNLERATRRRPNWRPDANGFAFACSRDQQGVAEAAEIGERGNSSTARQRPGSTSRLALRPGHCTHRVAGRAASGAQAARTRRSSWERACAPVKSLGAVLASPVFVAILWRRIELCFNADRPSITARKGCCEQDYIGT